MKKIFLLFFIPILFQCNSTSKESLKVDPKYKESIFRIEKDAIAFLGLMSVASKQFDPQFIHQDGEMTHTKGLNIFAAIVDNRDGELVGQNKNQIHSITNPTIHAEQMTLKDATERMLKKNPRDAPKISVENYYKNFLFNDLSDDYLNSGNTLYTTLEPCPFCTSTLLVARMKRIVYIIPDQGFGGAFYLLKDRYWKKSNALYEQIDISDHENSKLISFASKKYADLLEHVSNTKKIDPKYSDAYLLDKESDFLKEIRMYFLSLKESDLVTTGEDKVKNAKLLKGFLEKVK